MGKQVGRGFTAARQRASRLAGLAGLKPCTLLCAGAQGHRGRVAWPGFYRRGTTGATARRSCRAKALHPFLCGSAAQGHTDKYGALETLGGGPRVSVAFVPKVAARQRTSRLAGLVWIPCQLNRKDRRRATGPPARNKCQRGFETTLAFCVTEISKISTAALLEYARRQPQKKIKPVFPRCETIPAASMHLKHRHLSLPTANCGGAERR